MFCYTTFVMNKVACYIQSKRKNKQWWVLHSHCTLCLQITESYPANRGGQVPLLAL